MLIQLKSILSISLEFNCITYASLSLNTSSLHPSEECLFDYIIPSRLFITLFSSSRRHLHMRVFSQLLGPLSFSYTLYICLYTTLSFTIVYDKSA